MTDFGYTNDSPPPPGGRAWLDADPVEHGALWRFGEWMLQPGNIEMAGLCVVVGAFSVLMIAAWLVS